MKRYTALALAAILTFGLAACGEEKTTKTETSETTDVNGTVIETETSTETTVDEDGNRSKETETKTTIDPEGPMNKETVEEIKTEESQQ